LEYVGTQVLRGVVMKIYIFWDITSAVRWNSTEFSEENFASETSLTCDGLHGFLSQKI
jgi:hypothetical protein